MTQTRQRQIRDSEEDIINMTYWDIAPYFRMIRKGETELLKESLDIRIDEKDFHERFSRDRKKEMEYMAVSLVNTFMIAAIEGGVYPPDANWTADSALHRISQITQPAGYRRVILDTAVSFCEKVHALKHAETGNPHAEKVRQYILTHLTQPIDIDMIAENTGISRYHLSRLFKQSFGVSIGTYLCDERIEAAKELLVSTQEPVARIAVLLQFCDQSYFSAVFRRKTGMTPGQYRKRNAFMEE